MNFQRNRNVRRIGLDASAEEVPMARTALRLYADRDERQAFAVVVQTIADLPTFIRDVHTSNPSFAEGYMRACDASMFEVMLAVVDGLIDERVEEERKGVGGVEDDDNDHKSDVSQADWTVDEAMVPQEDADNVEVSCRVQHWSMSDYLPIVQANLRCLRMVPHLLRTVSYVFSEHGAQVVPMILHRTASESVDIHEDIVNFQRLLLYVLGNVYSKALADDKEIGILHVPHKRRVVQEHVIYDCYSLREAQVLVIEDDDRQQQDRQWLSYSYLGGGVTWDPPFGYGLVSRHLPLRVADRFLALLLFVSGGEPVRETFVRRTPIASVTENMTAMEKEECIAKRIGQVTKHLQRFRDVYSTVQQLVASVIKMDTN
jgi:hypothetical protein